MRKPNPTSLMARRDGGSLLVAVSGPYATQTHRDLHCLVRDEAEEWPVSALVLDLRKAVLDELTTVLRDTDALLKGKRTAIVVPPDAFEAVAAVCQGERFRGVLWVTFWQYENAVAWAGRGVYWDEKRRLAARVEEDLRPLRRVPHKLIAAARADKSLQAFLARVTP